MKINTQELTGAALDWAVAEAEGLRPFVRPKGIEVLFNGAPRRVPFSPSTDWAQGGPIIEREKISVEYGRADFKADWVAYKLGLPHEDNPESGPTPLIAAMRCYVASKLGDEVEITEELL